MNTTDTLSSSLNMNINTLQYAMLQALIRNKDLLPVTESSGFTNVKMKNLYFELLDAYNKNNNITTAELYAIQTSWALRLKEDVQAKEDKEIIDKAVYIVENELTINDASIIEHFNRTVYNQCISKTESELQEVLNSLRSTSPKNIVKKLSDMQMLVDNLASKIMVDSDIDSDEFDVCESDIDFDVLAPIPRPRIPTGMKGWDIENLGMSTGHVVTIGATSGSGKSAMASQLALNMAMAGANVMFISLEMSRVEVTHRFLASVTGTNISDFANPEKYDQFFKESISQDYANKFLLSDGILGGGDIIVMTPRESYTMQQLLQKIKQSKRFFIKPKNPEAKKVIIIDYLSLLAGFSGDDGWKKLIEASRVAKLFAEANDILMILLVQTDENFKVRYSTGINDNADLSWIWKYGITIKELESSGVNLAYVPQITALLNNNPGLMVTQLQFKKGRSYNRNIKNDMVLFDFSTMTVKSVEKEADAVRAEYTTLQNIIESNKKKTMSMMTGGNQNIKSKAKMNNMDSNNAAMEDVDTTALV